MLKTAARTGAKQYVILGAGLDTFAFRELEFAEKYPVFEVDHPLTQAGGEAMQSSFSEPELEKLLERHGFLIYELLTPADIQRSIIDPAGADISAFEHVRHCPAVRKL